MNTPAEIIHPAGPPARPSAEKPSREEIESAVEKIVRQPDFAASPRICAFLKFITEETLSGRSAELKAFSIAVAVYERDETFDPQTSSIVRVEATRLRRLLERYYSGDGADDPVVVGLPRGSYTPSFSFRQTEEPAPPVPPLSQPQPRLSPLTLVLGALLLAVAGAGLIYTLNYPSSGNVSATLREPPARLRPAIVVEAKAGIQPPQTAERQSRILAQLPTLFESALNASEHVTVLEPDPARKQPPDYTLELRPIIRTDPSVLSIQYRIVHERTGEIIWTRIENGKDYASVAAVQALASAITQPNGVIFADQRRRYANQANVERPFSCIVRGYDFILSPTKANYRSSAECLAATTKKYPHFQLAHAILANVHADAFVYGFKLNQTDRPLELAVASAQSAFAIGSHSMRTRNAIFKIQFLEKRFDAAFETARSASASNSHGALFLGRVGSANILRGEYEKGRDQIMQALKINEGLAPVFAPYLFIAAHMNNDTRHATIWGTNRAAATTSPISLIGRIIIAHNHGEIEAVSRWSSRLRTLFPEFSADIAAGLDRYAATGEIRKRLTDDLAQTGFVMTASAKPAP